MYNHGEKPGRLLAWDIKQIQSKKAINSVEDANGEVTVDPLKINYTFEQFCKTLYSSQYLSNNDALNLLNLDKLNLEFPHFRRFQVET